ncbi:hypothetical protein M1L60_03135 [Actinoplanes sp. TRM 88003]|uniref:TetR family transcriptional regulator n=1 Tax=Paractinoplanes aksuensis TaxID=2939490 RepID=A0ABT1DFH7_9ACTN|nr:hypothetical protein [Actinoplanes aksuensis]MCO8269581.1 hypothetical protein [Actinoplanes aksuensis]
MDTPDSVRLRELVVRAAIPLLGEIDTLPMARLADAAGVGEAELLAVFPDKDAVVRACATTIQADMVAMMDATREVAALDAVRRDQPLESRLADALTIFDAHHRRVRTAFAAYEQAMLDGSRTGASTPSTDVTAPRPTERQDRRIMSDLPEVRDAVARLLEPDRSRLRLPVEALAAAFLTLCQAGSRMPTEAHTPLPPEQVVDLFLNGALTTS